MHWKVISLAGFWRLGTVQEKWPMTTPRGSSVHTNARLALSLGRREAPARPLGRDGCRLGGDVTGPQSLSLL